MIGSASAEAGVASAAVRPVRVRAAAPSSVAVVARKSRRDWVSMGRYELRAESSELSVEC